MSASRNNPDALSKSSRPRKKRPRKSSRKHKLRPANDLEMIDGHLLETIAMTVNGKSKKVTVLAGIVFQLLQQDLAGDVYAGKVLLKYQALAKRVTDKSLELEFVDDDDTPSGSEGGHD